MGREPDTIGGFCRRCGREHHLDARLARTAARELMDRLDRDREMSGLRQELCAPGGGKMLGVLLCRDRSGTVRTLKGFSGQVRGGWLVPGWVEPVFDPCLFTRLQEAPERRIKALTRALARLPGDSPARRSLVARRRRLSRHLMDDLFSLYRLVNFRGEERVLAQVFLGTGIPTGTGDCCAPKLLVHAARQGFSPLSLAEFFYGDPLPGGQRRHRVFYPPCRSRCRPILGFLLCGLEGTG